MSIAARTWSAPRHWLVLLVAGAGLAGCMQPDAGDPEVENRTDETMLITLVEAATGEETPPKSVRPQSANVLVYATSPETGCFAGPGGRWEQLNVYVEDVVIDDQLSLESLTTDPLYVQDLEADPICEDEIWEWTGEQLQRID